MAPRGNQAANGEDKYQPAEDIDLVNRYDYEVSEGLTQRESSELVIHFYSQLGMSYLGNRLLCEILGRTQQGRGVLGVVDGFSPRGVEGEDGRAWWKEILRKFGYKL